MAKSHHDAHIVIADVLPATDTVKLVEHMRTICSEERRFMEPQY